MIDPAADVDRYLELADSYGARLTDIFDTHLHADHISIGVNLYDGVTRDFQKGLVSADWHVYLFTREAEEVYNLQDGLLLDDYKYYNLFKNNPLSENDAGRKI